MGSYNVKVDRQMQPLINLENAQNEWYFDKGSLSA